MAPRWSVALALIVSACDPQGGAEPEPASTEGDSPEAASTNSGSPVGDEGTPPGTDDGATGAGDGPSGDTGSDGAVGETEAESSSGGDGDASSSGGDGSSGQIEPSEALMWLLDGESGALQSEASAHDGASTGSCGATEVAFVVADDQPVHSGDYSLQVRFDRAWLDDDAGCTAVKSFFTQSVAVQIDEDEEYWHGWAVHVPDAAGDSWTTARWATTGQPNKALSIDLRSDLTWRFKSTQIGIGDFDLTLSPATANFGDGATEVWHEFVANFVISTDEDQGFFRVWHRLEGAEAWTQVLDAQGRTANFAAPFPFEIRHGMHSGHEWSDDDATSRVLYFDEIRFGGAEVGFEGVAPGAGTVPVLE